jgi:hypothetical protein
VFIRGTHTPTSTTFRKRLLAHGEPVYRQLPRGSVRRALESLRDAAIIQSEGRGAWRFTNPLFRRYLATLGPFD